MNIEQTAVNAKHRLICQHVCRWTKTYAMPCHVLKSMPDGRLKVLVFGERHWKGREHISRIRYVEAGRVEKVTTEAVADCSNNPALRAIDAEHSAESEFVEQDLPVGFGTLSDQTQEQAEHAYSMGVAAGLIKVRDPSGPLDERIFDLVGNPLAKS